MQRFVKLAALYEQEIKKSTDIGFTEINTPDITGILGQGILMSDEQYKQREFTINKHRIEAWIGTVSYMNHLEDFQLFLKNRKILNMDVERQISKLKTVKNMGPDEVEVLFASILQNVTTNDQILEVDLSC
jgi:hypothetical protein